MEKDNHLVSVIIPVYNAHQYLHEAIRSVLEQSYQNLEIIIIDDGSSDGSEHICDEYAKKDSRVRLFHQENKGLSDARNKGLEIALGEIIAFLDADDAYHTDYIKAMVDAMFQEKTDIVLCRYVVCKTANNLEISTGLKAYPSIRPGRINQAEALAGLVNESINNQVWNKIYRRRLWDDIRFPAGQVYEDMATTYKVVNNSKSIFALDKTLYMYRVRPKSITDTVSEKNITDRISSCSRFVTFVEKNTPAIFSSEQLIVSEQMLLNQMISCFFHYSGKTKNYSSEFEERLTDQISSYGRQMGIKNMSQKTKLLFYIINYCPWILKIISPLYYRLQQ